MPAKRAEPSDEATLEDAGTAGARAGDRRTVDLLSVNVGRPRVIGSLGRNLPVVSGIAKTAVTADTLRLDRVNLEGDGQADLRVHGGPDKAVYAYPSEHLPRWNAELRPYPPFGPGTFGENLTTVGWLEEDVRIGDVWAWGDALLQVTQPRTPCYKLGVVTGRLDLLGRLVETGRTGWYLRVLRTGVVPVTGPIAVVERDPAGVTVRDAHRAAMVRRSPELAARVAAVSALAPAWRAWLDDG